LKDSSTLQNEAFSHNLQPQSRPVLVLSSLLLLFRAAKKDQYRSEVKYIRCHKINANRFNILCHGVNVVFTFVFLTLILPCFYEFPIVYSWIKSSLNFKFQYCRSKLLKLVLQVLFYYVEALPRWSDAAVAILICTLCGSNWWVVAQFGLG